MRRQIRILPVLRSSAAVLVLLALSIGLSGCIVVPAEGYYRPSRHYYYYPY